MSPAIAMLIDLHAHYPMHLVPRNEGMNFLSRLFNYESPAGSLIRIVDGYGEELWVNADHIRAIQRGNVVPLETGVTRRISTRNGLPPSLPAVPART